MVNTSDPVMVWKGVDNDPRLWWAQMRNTVWAVPPRPFGDRQMNTNVHPSLF
jgi:hypothetical protein